MPGLTNNMVDREQTLDNLTEHGLDVYETTLKAALESQHYGAVVAIQPDTGEYAVGEDSFTAIRAIRAQNVKGLVFVRRVGTPTDGDKRFAARVAAAEAKNGVRGCVVR